MNFDKIDQLNAQIETLQAQLDLLEAPFEEGLVKKHPETTEPWQKIWKAKVKLDMQVYQQIWPEATVQLANDEMSWRSVNKNAPTPYGFVDIFS